MTGVILNHDPLVPEATDGGGRYLEIIPTDFSGRTDDTRVMRVWWPRVDWAGGRWGSVPPEPTEPKLAIHVLIYKEWSDHHGPSRTGRLMSAHFLTWMEGHMTDMWHRAADSSLHPADSLLCLIGRQLHRRDSEASCPATILESADSQILELADSQEEEHA